METDKGLERLYELIESYEFNELTDFEKDIVLKHISETEYTNIRNTISETKDLFEKIPMETSQKSLGIKRIINYPIQLYKVAAAILLFVVLGIAISKSVPEGEKEMFAQVDTVFVDRLDTIIVEKTNTVEVVKEKIVFREKPVQKNKEPIDIELASISTQKPDCEIDLCPEDMEKFRKVKASGSVLQDSALSDFLVSIN